MHKLNSERNTVDIPAKVLQYENFLNEVLRKDLQLVTQTQARLVSQLSNYREIRGFIQAIQQDKFELDAKRGLRTKMDLGHNFYVNAVIPSTDKIVLSIGLNFYAELKLDEALSFIEKKEKQLLAENGELVQKSCKIKANIKLVLDGLRELQGISPIDTAPKSLIDL